MELPTWTSKSLLQRKHELANPDEVIEKRICDFTVEGQKSYHLWSFLFVPCLYLSKCVFISVFSFLFFFLIFTLSFSELSAQFFF